MIDEDNLDGRIHADYADKKLSPSRLEEYRSLLRDTGVMRLWAHGKSKPFELIVDGTGFLAQGDYKGYLYDPAPQNPPLASLDDSCFLTGQIPDSQRFYSGIRSLGNGWWLIRYEFGYGAIDQTRDCKRIPAGHYSKNTLSGTETRGSHPCFKD